jgi:hypothetical protein
MSEVCDSSVGSEAETVTVVDAEPRASVKFNVVVLLI